MSQEQLLETARLCFASGGYAGTTLDEIARQLGVTAPALIRRAGTKQQLFLQAMCSASEQELPPAVVSLSNVALDAEPAVVLRKLAENVIPFLEKRIQQSIVLMMHLGSERSQGGELPFPTGQTSPPALALRQVESYFRKLQRRGSLKLSDPRAAALLFLGSLQSYVFFHRVLRVASPPYPVSKFVSQLIQLWSAGGIVVVTPQKTGGTRSGSKTKKTSSHPSRDAGVGGGRRLHAAGSPAKGDGVVGISGGADRQRRLPGRRSRKPHAGR